MEVNFVGNGEDGVLYTLVTLLHSSLYVITATTAINAANKASFGVVDENIFLC